MSPEFPLQGIPGFSLEEAAFHMIFHFLKHFQWNGKREQILAQLAPYIFSAAILRIPRILFPVDKKW